MEMAEDIRQGIMSRGHRPEDYVFNPITNNWDYRGGLPSTQPTPADSNNIQQQISQQTSGWQAAKDHFVESILPTGGALGLGTQGAKLGSRFGPIGGIVGGLGGAALGGAATSMVQNQFLTPEFKQRLSEESKQHPITSLLGSLATQAPFMFVDPNAMSSTAKGLRNLITIKGPTSEQVGNILNTAIGAGVGGGIEGINQYRQGEFDPTTLALSTLGGAALSSPTKLGQKVFGMHANPATENIDFKNSGQGQTLRDAWKQQIAEARAQGDNPIAAENLTQPTIPFSTLGEGPMINPVTREFAQQPPSNLKVTVEHRIADDQIPYLTTPHIQGAGEKLSMRTLPEGPVLTENQLRLLVGENKKLDPADLVGRFEQAKYQPETPASPTEPKLPVTVRFLQNMQRLAGKQGIDLQSLPGLENAAGQDAAGVAYPRSEGGKGVALNQINPEFAKWNTLAHEPAHTMLDDFAASGDRTAAELIGKAKALYGGEEPFVQGIGEHFVDRVLQRNGEGPVKSFFKDLTAWGKSKTGMANKEDITRLMSNELNIPKPAQEGVALPQKLSPAVPVNIKPPVLTQEQRAAAKAAQETADAEAKAQAEAVKNLPNSNELSQLAQEGKTFNETIPPTGETKPAKFQELTPEDNKNLSPEASAEMFKNLKKQLDMPSESPTDATTIRENEAARSTRNARGKFQDLVDKDTVDDLFTTEAERELDKSEPFKLIKAKQLPSNFLGKMQKELPKDEYSALKDAGIEKFVAENKPTKEVLKKWISENGPKLEVKKLHASDVYEVPPEKIRHAELQHELDTNGIEPIYGSAPTGDNTLGRQAIVGWKYKGRRITPDEMQSPWSQKMSEFEDLYQKIRTTAIGPKTLLNRDSATLRYPFVNPKKLADMPDAVDLLVRVPLKVDYTNPDKRGVIFSGPHYGNSDKNVVASVRGYMETDPATGKKTFYVFEVQSDWAQEKRKMEALNDKSKALGYSGDQDADRWLNNKNDPSLNHYENLALKAAISHAIENGADHIAISDSKTAMMTEKHDKAAAIKEHTDGKVYQTKDEAIKAAADAGVTNPKIRGTVSDGYVWAGNKQYVISQQPGMELHYDRTLPGKLARLTGDVGTPVDFGKHQNGPSKAFNGKDNVTGLSYDLSGIKQTFEHALDKKFSQFGKFQNLTESGEAPTENTRYGFFRKMSPAFDKVKNLNPVAGEALHNFDLRKDLLEGRYVNELADESSNYSREERNRVESYRYDVWKDDSSDIELTPREQELNAIQAKYLTELREKSNEAGLLVGGERKGKINADYHPNMLSNEALGVFLNEPLSTKADEYRDLWANHIVEESAKSDQPKTYEEAQDFINKYITALGTGTPSGSIEFKALREFEGYGLPKDLVEPDMMLRIRKYGRRASKDLAYFMELQNNPEAAKALGIRDQFGKLPEAPDVRDVSQHPDIKNAKKLVYGSFAFDNPRINATKRVLGSMIMGTASGARDVANIPVNALPYINSLGGMKSFLTGLSKFRQARVDSLKYNARRKELVDLEFGTLSNPDRFVSIASKMAQVIRVAQGRDMLEQFSRIWTYGIGQELAAQNFRAAVNGDTKGVEWLKKFGKLVDVDGAIQRQDLTPDELGIIAKQFVDRNQGTYGGRGLPTGAIEGQLSPFLQLSKWGIEKSNVIYQDVFQPAAKGNYIPLLSYTLGSILTGEGIRRLNELMTNKRSENASVQEALAAGKTEDTVAAFIALAQYGNYAGIMSDSMKVMSDLYQGKHPSGGPSFPLADFVSDTLGNSIAQYSQAVNSGTDRTDAALGMVKNIIHGTIQDYRLVMSHISADTLPGGEKELTERKNKFRDMRVFNKLADVNEGEINPTPSNELQDADLKTFKRTQDVTKAMQLLPALIQKAVEHSQNDPMKLKQELSKIKDNSYQTMPDPQKMPMSFINYVTFLRNTQGDDAANARLADYLMQKEINKFKSSLIPSMGMK